MRTRLLANPGALADYEILEMLLFLGIPRRDTKPLAKALINRFGGFAETLAATKPDLERAGLPAQAIPPLALAQSAVEALARPEVQDRPVLGDLHALERHLGLDAPRPAGLTAVLLDSRNRLLAQPTWSPETPTGPLLREILREALARHAVAAILVRDRPGIPLAVTQDDRALLASATESASALAVVVHDLVLTGRGGWTSLRAGRR